MANKWSKGEFLPQNWGKYMGSRAKPIIYRSSWEYTMMRLFDNHPNVLGWASEPMEIPYCNPLTRRWTVYVPDFIVVYADVVGQKHAEMIEVKPAKENIFAKRKAGERLSESTKAAQTVNLAKWQAAAKFCAKNGMVFRVASEDEIFAYQGRK